MQLQVMLMEFSPDKFTLTVSPFRYTNWETENEMLVDSMRADAMPENRNLEFSVFAIVCPLTTHVRAKMVNLPDAVGINIDNVESMRNRTTFVRIKYPRNVLLQEAEKKIAVCVPPAHKNYSNALRIVEQLEIYRRLGVAKFYFYNSSITSNVEKVFNYYKEVGVASIIPWNIRSKPSRCSFETKAKLLLPYRL